MDKTIAIVGSTGSIGRQTLEVVRHLGYVRVASLSANTSIDLLEEQIREFVPSVAAVGDRASAMALADRVSDMPTRILYGEDGIVEAACHGDAEMTVVAVVGNAGIRPAYEAIQAGKDLALANKESLVACGQMMMDAVREKGISLVPVDSEHSAIFQCLAGAGNNEPRRIILTASGGPFRGMGAKALASVTPADALSHPTWKMGPKITVDSASLMNKGAEMIEAHWLFGVSPENIEVHVHPQSIVHSAVEFADGSVIAQMGVPDMRVAIQLALTWPARLPSLAEPLDLFALGKLEFFRPDTRRFPCLSLAYEALSISGTMPASMNAANELAVAAFLEGGIGFTSIPAVIGTVMGAVDVSYSVTLDTVLEADRQARILAAESIAKLRV